MAIRDLLEDWSSGVRAKDYERNLAHHSPALLMFDVPPPFQFKGLPADWQTWDLFFSVNSAPVVFDFDEMQITASRSVAYVTALMHREPTENGKRARLDFPSDRGTGRPRAAGSSPTSTTRSPPSRPPPAVGIGGLAGVSPRRHGSVGWMAAPSIEPFRANVSEVVLADLRERLAGTRWPEPIAGVGWTEGVDLAWLRRVVHHWETRFDWRRHEARLNAFPQFLVRLGEQRIHTLHARGRGPKPLPLIITHGWPGSVFEMLQLIPLLTDPSAHGGATEDAFDVVVPSIPGYGFSDIPTTPGTSNAVVAELWLQLMEALGYGRFGAQGGDWGAGISTWAARKHPERMVGLHLNYIPGSFRPWVDDEASLTGEERAFLADKQQWSEEEGAYGHVQATRPGTLGIGLTDSPAGLAAWILEKIRSWSDCDGDLESRFSLDEALANVTLYWVTRTAASSLRLYRESSLTPLQLGPGERIRVPMGFARFPLEAPAPPRRWIERGYELRHWTDMPRGGHFAAWEEPQLLAQDIRAFFRPLR